MIAGLAVLALAAVGCSDDNSGSVSSTGPSTTLPSAVSATSSAATPSAGLSRILAEGTFDLVAALAFEDPGFHQVIDLEGVFAEEVPAGGQLVLRLYDASRPDQECGSEHPLSGCATVDWSDSANRPSVPAGGVFDNRLSLAVDQGTVDLFLSESGGLVEVPDRFDPG